MRVAYARLDGIVVRGKVPPGAQRRTQASAAGIRITDAHPGDRFS
jgi:hypothetical protein